MRGIIADVNIERHFQILVQLLQAETRQEYWNLLSLTVSTLADLSLPADIADSVLWRACQREELVLVTGNRNAKGLDSLETTIQRLNTATCLPVITVATPDRILAEKAYAARTADKLLEYLVDMANLLGTGRLYVP